MNKHYSFLDKILINFQTGLKSLTPKHLAQRKNPAEQLTEPHLTAQEKKHSAGLMRVNHAGEIAAQALYLGQALTARNTFLKENLKEAAREEEDHLAWCEERLKELNNHTTYLAPLWFFGSFLIGSAAGIAGDKWSLGFVAETEYQVEQHLNKHLNELSRRDHKSRVIIEKMRDDEVKHAKNAEQHGAKPLPVIIRSLMKNTAKIMTATAYWL